MRHESTTSAAEECRVVSAGARDGSVLEGLWDSSSLVLDEVSGDRVRARASLDERHHQPYGLVHGGVYATLVEQLASIGACAAVRDQGMFAVGTHNATDFLRPVVTADLDLVAEPIFQGRTQQVWTVELRRADDRKLVAKGQLRLQNLPLEA